MPGTLHFGFFIDVEATQPAIADPALGERSSRGFAEVLEAFGLRGTFHLLPGDAAASPGLYRELRGRGHEIGLHVHPAAQARGEFLGVYGPDEQRAVLGEARTRFEQALGFAPGSVCIGYGSTNDYTYGVLHGLGFRHGMCSIPSRVLPECASVHAGSPLGAHYAHRYNRVLAGDLDFVEVPVTVDPDSRMWGGKHPQDLRVELVDAKNHWYTIQKAVERQTREDAPMKYVLGITHNIFEYAQPADFRRQTLEGMCRHAESIARAHGLDLQPATIAELADAYRAAVPLGGGATRLTLDRRGHGVAAAGGR